jgi:thymidylate kinase
VKAHRASSNGEIIICDRYPTKQIGTMDSPRLRKDYTKKGIKNVLINWMAKWESALYLQIPPPDIVLRLQVSHETAQKRNGARKFMDNPERLKRRHQQTQNWQIPTPRLIQEIDTEAPLEETIFSVRRAIWKVI